MPLAPVELHWYPASGRSRIRRFSFGVRRQRLALGVGALLALHVLVGLAVTPTVISSSLLERRYDLQVSRRVQSGERLQALVGRLEELSRRGAELARRVERIEAIYGLGGGAGGRERGSPPPGRPVRESIFGAVIARGNRLEAALAADLAATRDRLSRIAEHERREPDAARALPVLPPLAGETFVRTSLFGPRRSPYTREIEFHAGLDLAAPIGSPIRAPAAGVVTYAGAVEADRRTDWWRLGKVVALRHGDRYLTLFGHCDTIAVRRGQRVAAGETVATVGDTGWTTAAHLHYEVRRRSPAGAWLAVDPLDYAFWATGPLAEGRPAVANAPAREGGAAEPQPLLPAFLR